MATTTLLTLKASRTAIELLRWIADTTNEKKYVVLERALAREKERVKQERRRKRP